VSLLDITDRRRAEQALELHSHVLESMTEGVSVSDESGSIIYTNPAEDRMFGYAPGELQGQRVTVQNAYPPEENERRVAEVIGLLHREGAWAGEWYNRRKDGTTFFTESNISRLGLGEKPLWVCVQRDITDRKRQEAQRELLVGELAHRVKNTLAIVQSLASQTARRAESLKDFYERFSGRLDALARTHDLLMREGWEHVGLGELIEQTVKLALPERVRLSGPPVELSPNVAVTLSMLLHELNVNAVKYGALGAEGGGVEVNWRIAAEDASVELSWIERGGPPVHATAREGFGTRLLQSIERELGARISREFARDGLRCRMRLPLGASVRLVPAGGSAPAHPPA
jgi:two-component system CheB/CheR fusion protein